MKNIRLFTFIAVLIVLAQSNSIYNNNDWIFNPNYCRLEKQNDWDTLYCECTGGSGDYQYQYSSLPPGWQINNQRIYIPRNKIEPGRVYGCKLSVFDRKLNRYLRRSLFFNYDFQGRFGRLVDANWDWDLANLGVIGNFVSNNFRDFRYYNDNTWNNNVQYGLPPGLIRSQASPPPFANYLPPVPTLTQGPTIYTQSQVIGPGSVIPTAAGPVINNIYAPNNIIPNQYGPATTVFGVGTGIANPYFDAFPTDDQCERVVAEGDCTKIRDFIRYSSENKFQCKLRAAFLEKLQSRIQNRIASSRTDAQNLRQAIVAIQSKIKQLGQKQQRVQSQISLNQLSQRLQKYQQQVLSFNRDRDDYQQRCKGYRDSISKYRLQIQSINSATSVSRSAAIAQQSKMRELDARINQLQIRVRQLRDDREQARRKRDYHQGIVEGSLRRIEECNSKILGVQKYIDQYDVKTKYYVTSIDDINRKIDGCNRDIEAYRTGKLIYKSGEISNKLSQLQQQIVVKTRQSQRLTRIYTELQKYQNQFQQQISKHYFSCYKYLPPKNDPKKRNHYTIQAPAFYKYLKDTFGQLPNQNIRARFTGILDVKRLSPLSVTWSKVYDIPSTVGYGSNMDKAQNNYLCTESEDKLKVFTARIQEINKNVIVAAGRGGQRFVVHLGGCTRMELVSDKDLPQIGQELIFKGYQKDPFQIYAHHVTCYS